MATENEVISELRRISKEGGGILKPEVVVEEARDEQNPLHSRFTWDDTEAAKQHRLNQARYLIRTTVQYIKANGDERPVRVFVSLTNDRDDSGYREVVAVLSDNELRKQMLKDALDELKRIELKYSDLKELAELFKVSKQIRQQLS